MLDSRTLKMRVWERGSGETMACGTGACASVVAACLNGYCRKGRDVRVLLRGGELTIRYTDEGVLMTGARTRCLPVRWRSEDPAENRCSTCGPAAGFLKRLG